LRLLNETIDLGIAKQGIISGVALTENYLAEMLRLICIGYPDKLKIQEKKIDMEIVLRKTSIKSLLLELIDRQIHALFYKAPADYFEHFEKITSIEINDEIKRKYSEIKASRDLLIHNEGIINQTYISKAGEYARGKINDEIDLDEIYFDDSISLMKKLINTVYSKLLKKYGESEVWTS